MKKILQTTVKSSALSATMSVIVVLLCMVMLSSSADGKRMSFKIASDGMISLRRGGEVQISRSPVGMLVWQGALEAPQSAKREKGKVMLAFEHGQVVLDCQERANGSLRLSVASVPEGADAFVFGPYACPATEEVGEYLGAAWHKDGSVVCIQSLNPKTVGEFVLPYKNPTAFHSPDNRAATLKDGVGYLSCGVIDWTRPRPMIGSVQTGGQMAEIIPAPEGEIKGGAIILTCAKDGETLLQDIGRIEVEEHMPHPTINGEWAKTSPHASDIYLVFHNGNTDAQIRMAERADINWIYFSDPFKSWGHFGINTHKYPGGMEEFKATIRKAKEHGINVGFHTLSNFIHTYDPFVSPVPHKDLLSYDPTPILKGISKEDTIIFIGKAYHYASHFNTSTVRIGDELIVFGDFDKERLCLTGCKRGAYGTTPSAHPEGAILTHMADHSYRTLFPSAKLQREMADILGNVINESQIRRMSFDGMEGCLYTGHGEFGCSSYVERVFKHCGDSLICDASTPSHYRWHAHSYFNWGEPWYDYQRLGGMYNYRASKQNIFHRNLLPGMLGWYNVTNSRGRFEATLPESVEYMLSRNVAFNAGSCLVIDCGESDKLNRYLDLIRIWQEFRRTVKVPDSLLAVMRDENSRWHLSRKGKQWELSQLSITEHDLGYVEKDLGMETGTGYQNDRKGMNEQQHRCMFVMDSSSPDSKLTPFVTEPFYCRIRVGTPESKGHFHGLKFCGGWYGKNVLLSFDVEANAGDYLEYRGGTTLYRYDKNYNLLQQIEATNGNGLIVNGVNIASYTLEYAVTGLDKNDPPLRLMLNHIRTVRKFVF